MTSNNFIDSAYNNKNNIFEFSNIDTGTQITKKINGNNIKPNVKEFKYSNNKDKDLITGDRFIPLKNSLDSNVQNFILNSSPFNFNSPNSPQKVDSISSSEGKIEKNYVNFIIDNMLKISSDKFIVKNKEIRKNKIFSFSKRIYNTTNKYDSKKNFNDKNKVEIDKSNNNNLNLYEKYKKIKNYEEEKKNDKQKMMIYITK